MSAAIFGVFSHHVQSQENSISANTIWLMCYIIRSYKAKIPVLDATGAHFNRGASTSQAGGVGALEEKSSSLAHLKMLLDGQLLISSCCQQQGPYSAPSQSAQAEEVKEGLTSVTVAICWKALLWRWLVEKPPMQLIFSCMSPSVPLIFASPNQQNKQKMKSHWKAITEWIKALSCLQYFF